MVPAPATTFETVPQVTSSPDTLIVPVVTVYRTGSTALMPCLYSAA